MTRVARAGGMTDSGADDAHPVCCPPDGWQEGARSVIRLYDLA